MEQLSLHLSSLKSLTKLYLYGNRIDDNGIKKLCDGFESLRELLLLDLDCIL